MSKKQTEQTVEVDEFEGTVTVDEFETPDHTVTFRNKEDEVVGELDFNTSEMKFTGNADESAQIFINFIKERWDV
jgi:hypothetical protein